MKKWPCVQRQRNPNNSRWIKRQKTKRTYIKNSSRAAKPTAGVPATTTIPATGGHESAIATVPADAASDGHQQQKNFQMLMAILQKKN